MYAAKKKGGRPHVIPDLKRLKRVYFYVNKHELLEIEKERERVEQTRAMYLRGLIFKERTLIHKIDSEALSLLNKISLNINQIAKRVNAAPKEKAQYMIFENELNDIKKELSNIHSAIMGGNMTDESENQTRE